ncbi:MULTISPECIES: ACP S-malonyltransferase [Paenibacillus]|jgi:trans-AT polyketide synthase/acyltransferase/oxidoreductase domain-containing protein|uniref:ACP S-malonyltransferase n=1 Tax=Paenibacillus TaxID=44249 RepID=UPI0003FB3BC8|nr:MULTISPECIES: ACP S-malonyltransferase [Paenibacillus]KEO76202.1 malonyl CoA-ACP transacylase [Paenibacillus polymyxa]MCH6190861.1 ACP S-malonyltransferase [Paenibacillus polymyxa]UMY53686.1 ACP S-malonyltransferase [Paenibacillus peoriae]WRL58344.1 ACP S-malonyltransferase [Paenibacillus polymyxa]
MLAFVFPGQGSQRKGMGEGLFEEFPELTRQANAILGYSIEELCLVDAYNQLQQTQFTQPALYTVNALMYLKTLQVSGVSPEIVAGHSLGEYNALFAGGAFDFATGLKLVKKRGELMSLAAGGKMAAIIGMDMNNIQQTLTQNRLDGIDIANLNSPQQVVISGLEEDMGRAKLIFEATSTITYIPLTVSGAFHSRYMEEAGNKFAAYLDGFAFSNLKIPVISNFSARPYTKSELKSNLVRQMTSSVKWCETVQILLGLDHVEIREIGPGHVLTSLTQKIKQGAAPITLSREEWNYKESEQIQLTNDTRTPTSPLVSGITPEFLGSEEFRKDYGIRYAYLTGAMFKGISSKEMVVKMGKAGMMGFLGTGGLSIPQIESDIQYIQQELDEGQAYGMNFLHTPGKLDRERDLTELYLKYEIRKIEVSAFINITESLIRYRANGLYDKPDGTVEIRNRVLAKVSRPEVAENFLSPAPVLLVEKMVQAGQITQEQAKRLAQVAMADDLCLEADSGGHTDGGVAYVLMPAITRLRDDMMKKYEYKKKVRVGAAGGIGTPEAAAAAFMLGADFIVTGSINQCTVEAGTSNNAKDMLEQINIQDTTYAPAGDMFELGAKVQVLKKGVFFPARANKLYDLYRQYNSLEEISDKDQKQIQEKYFKRSFDEVYEEVRRHYPQQEIEKAELNPKRKMALIFKWYFAYSSYLACSGEADNRLDYQIQCGPALGSFNQWVKGTKWERWQHRHVDDIGIKIMTETAQILNRRFIAFHGAVYE